MDKDLNPMTTSADTRGLGMKGILGTPLRRAALVVVGLAASLTASAAETFEYIHTDALGSPVAVTDANGVVIERTVYEPYGAVVGGPVKDGPGYTGHVADSATGLSYMQQRYMDPEVGAFLSVDPVTAHEQPVAQFSRYRYGSSNPYRYTDPDGRKACGKDTTCALEQGATGGSIQFSSPSTSRRDRESSSGDSGVVLASQRSASENSLRGGDGVTNMPRVISVAYQGYYHDDLVQKLAADMASKGVNVVTEVSLCLPPSCARIDIMGRDPSGSLFALEVKTGANPKFTPAQLAVYPHLRKGGILSSPDAKINQLGLARGVPLPPVNAVLLYQFDANSPPFFSPIP